MSQPNDSPQNPTKDEKHRNDMTDQTENTSSPANLAAESSRQVAIIGCGPVGIALATRLVKADYNVTISNSKGPETLTQEEQQTRARAVDARDAVSHANIVILAVPMSSIPALGEAFRSKLQPGAILIDAGNYYPSRDGAIPSLDEGVPDSVWVAQNFAAPTFKAFNCIIAGHILTHARAKGSPRRITLPVSGDDEKAIDIVKTLVDDVGFDAYNAGLLSESWRYQPGQPAYCTEASSKELGRLLDRASTVQGPISRDQARAIIEKLPPDFSSDVLLRAARFSAGLDRWDPQSWFAMIRLGFAILRAKLK